MTLGGGPKMLWPKRSPEGSGGMDPAGFECNVFESLFSESEVVSTDSACVEWAVSMDLMIDFAMPQRAVVGWTPGKGELLEVAL